VPASHDDAQIDELYRGPLSAFTAARNALVKTLRGADASRIRKLAKPTVVAWAVNQVYWHARKIYDQLIKSGERLRKAQIAALEGKKADVRDASDTHRRAIADAVKEAQRLAGAGGSQPSPDALMRTFEALSLASEPPEPPGRLTKELQPAGFEALTGVTPKFAPQRSAAPPPSRSAGPPPSRNADSAREREEAAAAKRQAASAIKAAKQRDADIRKAEAAVERARAAEAAARKTFDRASDALRDAEATLKQVRARGHGLH
jgi:hypothetical protein